MAQIAVGSTLNKVLGVLENITDRHGMKPSFGFGQSGDFNSGNNVTFPAIWIEPVESKVVNSIQGVRIEQLGLNMYALDRITKGDSNFIELMSDMKFLLETIIAYIRESKYTRDLYIMIDYQDQVMTPVMREMDENCNGYRVKLLIRTPVIYNPCNIPISDCQETTYVDEGFVDCNFVM